MLVPIICGSFVNVMADRWTLAFIGHWDYKDVAHFDGAQVGKTYSNITGLSLGVAATVGLATFCSQAHGAGRSAEQNPVFLRRSLLILSACFCFAATTALTAQPLLIALGQPPAVAETSAKFAQVQLIGVPFWWLAGTVNNVCNSMKRTRPGLIMNLVSSFVQVCLCWLLCNPAIGGMGYLGVALGRSLGGISSCIVIITYVRATGMDDAVWKLKQDSEPVFKPGALRDYLNVSLPSAVIIWSEFWAFELLALFAGWTPNAELNIAAHGAMFSLIVPVYMTWAGCSTALCALIGNRLGAEQNGEVPPMLRAAFFFSGVSSLSISLVYHFGRASLAAAFTDDPKVRALMVETSWGPVLSIPLYAELMTFLGALRGANFQRPAIVGNFVGYYVVGLPLACVLGDFVHWPTPLLGIWAGNVVALAIACSWVLSAVFLRVDWSTIRRVSAAGSDSRALLASGAVAGDEETPARNVAIAPTAQCAGSEGISTCREAEWEVEEDKGPPSAAISVASTRASPLSGGD